MLLLFQTVSEKTSNNNISKLWPLKKENKQTTSSKSNEKLQVVFLYLNEKYLIKTYFLGWWREASSASEEKQVNEEWDEASLGDPSAQFRFRWRVQLQRGTVQVMMIFIFDQHPPTSDKLICLDNYD